MSYYGFTVTDKGRALIAKLLTGDVLELTRVMVGTGSVPEGDDIAAVTDLYAPVAQGTCSKPGCKDGVARMTVEYRSDLNGGLNNGFWLREFGIFANDPDEGEVLIYYATLGGYPQWVSPYTEGEASGIDVRRFPISIAIGYDRGIKADFSTELWMTAEDVHSYFEVTLMPIVCAEIDKHIAEHNADKKAHPYILSLIDGLRGRLSLIELQFNTNVAKNPFLVAFETLDAVEAEGVWNKDAARMEF